MIRNTNHLFAVLAISANIANAQVTLGPKGVELPPKKDGTPQAIRDWSQPEQKEITISGAAEPVPALKYSLQVHPLRIQHGNGVSFYYRAFAMVSGLKSKIDELNEMSFEQLVANDVGKFLDTGRPSQAIDQIREATGRDNCEWDWQTEYMPDGFFQFLIPELDDARTVARLLAIDVRWHVGRGEFEEAAESLQMGYRLAQDVAKPKIVVANLVGLAIGRMMNDEVLNWIQTPDSPNLYWAITALPRPLISVSDAIETELMTPFRLFPILQSPETTNRSIAEWESEFRNLAAKLSENSDNAPKHAMETAMAGAIAAGYPRAKRQLAEEGISLQVLEKMPVLQVIAIFQSRVLRVMADEMRKVRSLPYDQQQSIASEFDQFRFRSFDAKSEILPIAEFLYPSVNATRNSEARCEVELDLLRTIEAIRAYVLTTGELPNRLDQISQVPMPRNPRSDVPFEYSATNDQATLTSNEKQFVMRLRKDKKP